MSRNQRHRVRQGLSVALATATALVAATACTSTPEPIAASPQPSLDEAGTRPSPPSTAVPGTTSGPLDQSDLPDPEELGPGWQYRVDRGDAEAGYSGSGAPAIARIPTEVLGAITPLGCRPTDLPTPQYALEVTYAKGALPGVGLTLAFADVSMAREFFDRHAESLRQCAERNRSPVEVLSDLPRELTTTRTEFPGETPTWVESMTVTDDRVTLLARADRLPSGS